MKRSITVFVVGMVIAATLLNAAEPVNMHKRRVEPLPIKTDLFEAGKEGYVTYRIPGIVVTKHGTVLAYCAARKNGIGDWDNINIALRRSTDGGRSWQPRQIIVDAGKATADNPTAIVDRQTQPGPRGAVCGLAVRQEIKEGRFMRPSWMSPAVKRLRTCSFDGLGTTHRWEPCEPCEATCDDMPLE